MAKILVLGGTRFFGKKLVQRWMDEQADITIATRGNIDDPFGDAVKRLLIDRTDSAALAQAIASDTYDIVYDNICYRAQEAEQAAALFADRAGKYIVTSTMAVYPFGDPAKREDDFDPYAYPLSGNYPAKPEYAEGKQQVEAVLFQQASFPVAAVRFPIVLGTDDYTRRLHFHVEHVRDGLPIGLPNPAARMSFIQSDEAADFLAWLGRADDVTGPVNACSAGTLSVGEIMKLVSEAVGKQAIVAEPDGGEHDSPFGVPASWAMVTAKAEAAGFRFDSLEQWMPKLIRELAAQG